MKKRIDNPSKKNKIIIILFLLCTVILLFSILGNSKKTKKEEEYVSIYDAQTMCVLMEESDLVNYMGEMLNSATAKKAEDTCLAQWDMGRNIENTEEKFIEVIMTDWKERKEELLGGYTLEEIYNESKEQNAN